MTDIVERLRRRKISERDHPYSIFLYAADEIELLREENERLRALRHVFRNADAEDWSCLFWLLGDSAYGRFWKAVLKEAREALADD